MKLLSRRFSISTLLLVVTVVAVLLGLNEYRKVKQRPDLTITAADVAWASDMHIWKLDMTEFDDVYGVQIVVFEESGKSKRWLCRMGGESRVDTSIHPVVTICAKCDNGNVVGKLNYTGGLSFEAKSLLKGGFVAWAGKPVLNENYFFLVSDSKIVGGGKAPFEKSSNKLAVEILRSPADL